MMPALNFVLAVKWMWQTPEVGWLIFHDLPFSHSTVVPVPHWSNKCCRFSGWLSDFKEHRCWRDIYWRDTNHYTKRPILCEILTLGNSSEMRKFLPLLLLFSFTASLFKNYVTKTGFKSPEINRWAEYAVFWIAIESFGRPPHKSAAWKLKIWKLIE